MTNNKYKKLITDMGLFAIGSLGSKLLLFLLIPLYTNVLSTSEYGIADLVFAVGDLILPFVSVTIYNGLLRFGLIEENKQDAIRCSVFIFLLGSLFTILITPIIGYYSPINAWKWFLASKIVSSFACLNSLIILKVKDKNKGYAIISILNACMLVSFNVLLLVVFKQGVKGYLYSSILSQLLTAVIAFIYGDVWKDLKDSSNNWPLMKEMVLFSLPFIINDVSWWLILSSNKVMIEWFVGSSTLGLYTTASKIPSLLNTFVSIFSQAWGIASIKEYDSTNDSSFYSAVFKYYLVFVFGTSILVIAFTKPFMKFYVGNSFFDAWHYVPLLLVSAAFAALSTFAGSLFSALKRSNILMISTVIAAVVNITANYLLIPYLGIWGAVLGSVLAYFVVAMCRLFYVKKLIGLDLNSKLLILVSSIVLFEAVFVGFDFYIIPVVVFSSILFVLTVRKEIIPLLFFCGRGKKN